MVAVLVLPLVIVARLGPLTCFHAQEAMVSFWRVAVPVICALLVGRVMTTLGPALTVNTEVTGAGLTVTVIWLEVEVPVELVMVTLKT